jgi:hypothetical protein
VLEIEIPELSFDMGGETGAEGVRGHWVEDLAWGKFSVNYDDNL